MARREMANEISEKERTDNQWKERKEDAKDER